MELRAEETRIQAERRFWDQVRGLAAAVDRRL